MKDKFVDSFNNKKFKCSEWIIIRNQFGYMVSVDFFLISINFIQTDSTGVTASENEKDFPSTTPAKSSTFDLIEINDEESPRKKSIKSPGIFRHDFNLFIVVIDNKKKKVERDGVEEDGVGEDGIGEDRIGKDGIEEDGIEEIGEDKIEQKKEVKEKSKRKINKKKEQNNQKKQELKEGEQIDLIEELEENNLYQTQLKQTASELKELIHTSEWNQSAYDYATSPDPKTKELIRTKLLLIEPRSAKQLQKDGGFHFDWIDNFIVNKSKTQPSGVVLILVRNDSKNTLLPLVEKYLKEAKNWIVHSTIIIKDKNPRSNALSRTKDLQFTSAKQIMYVMVQEGSKVSFVFFKLFKL